jgi:hypothetical protein
VKPWDSYRGSASKLPGFACSIVGSGHGGDTEVVVRQVTSEVLGYLDVQLGPTSGREAGRIPILLALLLYACFAGCCAAANGKAEL